MHAIYRPRRGRAPELAGSREPVSPDLLVLQHYPQHRWLDHRLDRFHPRSRGATCLRYAESRPDFPSPPRVAVFLIEETWRRYGIPIALTECTCTAIPRAHRLVVHALDRRSGSAATALSSALHPWSLLGLSLETLCTSIPTM